MVYGNYTEKDLEAEEEIDIPKEEVKDVKELNSRKDTYRTTYANVPDIERKLEFLEPRSIKNPGQQCTEAVARNRDVFNQNTVIDGKKVSNIKDIKRKSDDFVLDNKSYSVCHYDMEDRMAIENCSLSSPFLTYEDNKCKIKNGVCPDGFKFVDGECVFKDVKQFSRERKSFCEDKWYDWFRVPNHHLNNGYKVYRNRRSDHKKDITKCFEPCGFNEVPFVQDKDDVRNKHMNKCIPKKDLNYGMYSGIDYCPLALVHLLGMDRERMNQKYMKIVNDDLGDKKRRDDVYNIQQDINSKVTADAIEDVRIQANRYIEDSGVSVKDVKEPEMIEGKICTESVSRDDVESGYNICKDLYSDPDNVVNNIRNTYNYDDDRKLKKHVELLKGACKVSFDDRVDSNGGFMMSSKPVYAGMNWNILEGEFSDKTYDRINFDNNIDVRDNTHDAKELKDSKMMFDYDNMYNINNVVGADDSYFSYIFPMIVNFLWLFILLVFVYVIYQFGGYYVKKYLIPFMISIKDAVIAIMKAIIGLVELIFFRIPGFYKKDPVIPTTVPAK